MADLLFLAPSVPTPDGRAAQVRWYHMLRYLCGRYRVHFGGLAGPDCTPGQVARIKSMCYETCFVPRPPLHRRIHERVSGAHAADRELSAWSRRVAQHFPLAAALAGSASMAMHLAALPGDVLKLADYLDLESDELSRRAAGHGWPGSRIAMRQAGHVLGWERSAALHLDHILFASAAAERRFCERMPEHANRAITVANGVDPDHFSPHILHRSPYPPACRTLVLAGDMDQSAHAEAAEWFVREVFLPLREQGEDLNLHIVGAHPGRRLRALHGGGVTVTGAVADLRPWIAHAALVVAPLQRPCAVQGMLEALAMQQKVIASKAALDTAFFEPGAEVLQAGQGAEWMQAIRTATGSPALRALGKAARTRVLREYGWETRLAALGELLAPAAPRHASGA